MKINIFLFAYAIATLIFNFIAFEIRKNYKLKFNKILIYNLFLLAIGVSFPTNIKLYLIVGGMCGFIVAIANTIDILLDEGNNSNKDFIVTFTSSLIAFLFWPQIIFLNLLPVNSEKK